MDYRLLERSHYAGKALEKDKKGGKKGKGRKKGKEKRKGRRQEEIKACNTATIFGLREMFSSATKKITISHTTSINTGTKEKLGNTGYLTVLQGVNFITGLGVIYY